MTIDRPRLSLVVPAYNETQRLPPYLSAIRTYLGCRYGEHYEVLVVDDGSRDGLIDLLRQAGAGWPQLRWIQHSHNQGKGAAVRTGMLDARGELLLFADADGATPIDEETKLAAAIQAGADIAVGSRLADGAAARRSRTLVRGLAGRTFAATARTLLGLSVRDTQCGFKMFRGEVGRRVFSLVSETGYLFDLEVLGLATRLGYRIAEVPVNWHEVHGGQFSLMRILPRVAGGLWRLRQRLRRTDL